MKLEVAPRARIYVCVNEKAPEKVQCLKGEGEKCVAWLKEEVRRRGFDDVWVTRTRCQSYCEPDGTVVSFEPTHKQYSSVRFEDLPGIFEEFLRDLQRT